MEHTFKIVVTIIVVILIISITGLISCDLSINISLSVFR